MPITDTQLNTEAGVIKDETTANANTATRVGTMLENIIDNKINNDKIDDDPTLAADSSTLVPSQAAVKAYVDGSVTILKQRKVTLTSTDILGLTSSANSFILIPAPGAGKFLRLLQATCILNVGTTAYSGASSITIFYCDATASSATSVGTISTTFYTSVTDKIGNFNASAQIIDSTVIDGGLGFISLSVASPITLGDGTMDIYVHYYELSL
jgi:hypothetical protein